MLSLAKKSLLLGGLALLVFLIIGLFAKPTLAQDPSEQITDYHVAVTVNTDNTITVGESIKYDFGSNQRHGIFRDIPVHYKTASGNNVSIDVFNIKIADEDSQSGVPFTTNSKGNDLEIKIGDPNTLITGVHRYLITYSVDRPISFFSDHDELYWNAIGTGWTVPIAKADAEITLPEGVTKDQIKTTCYTGPLGATTSDCTSSVNEKNHAVFSTNSALGPNEGFTVVAGFPKGFVQEPTLLQRLEQTVADNFILVLPLLAFIIMFFIWRLYGKDAKGRGTVVAEYEPPQGMTPIAMGVALTDSVDNKYVSAEIIYLATKGFIKITRLEVKKLLVFNAVDYQLDKLKEPDATLTEFDKQLMGLLFEDGQSTSVSQIKSDRSFFRDLLKKESPLYDDLVAQGLFSNNPKKVKGWGMGIGGAVALLGIYFGGVFGTLGVLSFISSGAIIMIFGYLMPARTEKGAELKEYILGFKEYLSVVEKDRLEFANAPAKNPERFEKLLPYAMALGVEKQWAGQFEGIYNQRPAWYNDPSQGVFTAVILSNSLGDFRSSVGTAMASRSAAGGGSGFGGGFSGGGFGGGGGGSW